MQLNLFMLKLIELIFWVFCFICFLMFFTSIFWWRCHVMSTTSSLCLNNDSRCNFLLKTGTVKLWKMIALSMKYPIPILTEKYVGHSRPVPSRTLRLNFSIQWLWNICYRESWGCEWRTATPMVNKPPSMSSPHIPLLVKQLSIPLNRHPRCYFPPLIFLGVVHSSSCSTPLR